MHASKADSFLVKPILIVIILACFQLPFASFMADDFIILGILEKVSPFSRAGPLNLYSFADGNPAHTRITQESGAFPPLVNPHFKLNFFRPLSSALMTLDYNLFGLHPLGYSIHSILWLLILVMGFYFLMKKIMPGHPGRIATAVFAVSGIFGIAVFWAACCHNLIASALSLWAFLCYLHWQEKKRASFLVLSLIGFSMAFLAGETAVAMLAYPFAYTLLAPRAERKQRILRFIPLIGGAVVVTHLLHSRRQVIQHYLGFSKLLFQVSCFLLIFFQFAIGPSFRLLTPIALKKNMNVKLKTAMQDLDADFPQLTGKHVIILNAPDLVLGFHSYCYRRLYHFRMPVSWRVMYWGRGELRITRIAGNVFQMEFPREGFLRERLHQNDRIQLSDMEIIINNADTSHIKIITCTLNHSLDDPVILFLALRNKRFVPVKMPAIGASMILTNFLELF
jgi:Dolichyl-phosphate-mannose-protein mannosyltransferase